MSEPTVLIRHMTPVDYDRVRLIFLDGIETGNATFTTSAPDWASWDAAHLATCRLVVQSGANVVAWAALSPVSSKPAYRGVAEVSIYVDPSSRGSGIGRQLLDALIAESEAAGLWTLQAGVFPENTASVALHLRAGFRVVGERERIGQLHGVWRNVLLLERRSAT